MITSVGNFESITPPPTCAEFSATAGEFNGNVTFITCEGIESGTFIKANTTKILGCLQIDSVTAPTGITISILGDCA